MKWQRSRIPSSAASDSRSGAQRPVADEQQIGVGAARRGAARTRAADRPTRLISVMRPSQPTRKRPSGTPSSARSASARAGRGREPLVEIEPEPDHDDLLRRRDAERDEVVAHLGRDGDQRVAAPREPPLEPAGTPRSSPGRSSRAGHGRGTCGRRPAAAPARPAAPRAVRPRRPSPCACGGCPAARSRISREQLARGGEILERRDLPLQRRQVDRLDPELLGDVLHRALAAADRARRRASSRSRSGRAPASGTRRAAPARRR